jgi:glutaredoxin
MNDLTYFRLSLCPYCRRAEKYIEELRKENPEYCRIKINVIDENKNRQLSNGYDYWYVPCFYLGDQKLHEGAASRENIKEVLDAALRSAC